MTSERCCFRDRGEIKVRYKDDYQGAIEDLSNALEINPQDDQAYFVRGYAKLNLEDRQGAIGDWNRTLEINPEHSYAFLNRGAARELANDLEGACRDWRKAAELGLKKPAEWVKNQCK